MYLWASILRDIKWKKWFIRIHKSEATVEMLLVPSLFLTDGLLLWKNSPRLSSPLAAAEGAEESGLGLASSRSEGLSWRKAGLGIKACLGGGSLGTSGAPLMGLVLCRGTGLTGPSLSELSSSPSGRRRPRRSKGREEVWITIRQNLLLENFLEYQPPKIQTLKLSAS